VRYDEVAAQARDLRFIANDHSTVLPHEIEVWDPGGVSAVWVHVPQVRATGAELYMYWGNPQAESFDDPTGVWEGYAGVWHLSDLLPDGSAQVFDSSGSAHHGMPGGEEHPASQPGIIGRALSFAGDRSWVGLGAIETDDWDAITISAWMRHQDSQQGAVLSKAWGGGNNDQVFMLGADGERLEVRVRTDGGESIRLAPDHVVPVGTWVHAAFTWSARQAVVHAYVNGELIESAPLEGGALFSDPSAAVLGNIFADQNLEWGGELDEVRLERVARSQEWIAAQYASMTDTVVDFRDIEQEP
jgi:hypothetical protein